jgi:hypothetical protein
MLVTASFALTLFACGGSAPTPPAAPTAPTPPAVTPPAAPPAPSGTPESDKVTWKGAASGTKCHTTGATGDLATALTATAQACVGAGMHQVGSPTTGQGEASTATMVKTIPLAAKGGHCYRIFGLSEPTVKDFDIAVMDSAGKSAGEDGTDAADALVLENGVICFKADDSANVNTAVASGKGKWAVEIWSD